MSKRVERVTKEKPFGVTRENCWGGWDSIHASEAAARRAARALSKKGRKRVEVYRYSMWRGASPYGKYVATYRRGEKVS